MSEFTMSGESSVASRVKAFQDNPQIESQVQDVPRPRRAMTRSAEAAVTVGHGKRQDASFASPTGRASRDGTEGIKRDHTPPVGNNASHFAWPIGFLDEKEIFIGPGSGTISLERNKTVHSGQNHHHQPRGHNASRRHRSMENKTSNSSQSEFHEVRSRLRSVKEASGNIEDYFEKLEDEARRSGAAMGDLEQMIDDALEHQSALREDSGFAVSSCRAVTDSAARGARPAASHPPNKDLTGRHDSPRISPEWSASHGAQQRQASQAETATGHMKRRKRPSIHVHLHSPDLELPNGESTSPTLRSVGAENTQLGSPQLRAKSRSVRQRAAAFENIDKVTADQSTSEYFRKLLDENTQSLGSSANTRTLNTPKPTQSEDFVRKFGQGSAQRESTGKSYLEDEHVRVPEALEQASAKRPPRQDLQTSKPRQDLSNDLHHAPGSTDMHPSLKKPDVREDHTSYTEATSVSVPCSRKSDVMPRRTSGFWIRKPGWSDQDKSPSTPPAEVKENVHAAEKHVPGDIAEPGEGAPERDNAREGVIRADRKYATSLGRNAGINNEAGRGETKEPTGLTSTSTHGTEHLSHVLGEGPGPVQQQMRADRQKNIDSEHEKKNALEENVPDLLKARTLSTERSQFGEEQEVKDGHRPMTSGDSLLRKSISRQNATSRWTESGGKETEGQDLQATGQPTGSDAARNEVGLSKVQQRAHQLDRASRFAASQSQSRARAKAHESDQGLHQTLTKAISRSHEEPSYASTQDHDRTSVEVAAHPRKEQGSVLSSSLPRDEALLAANSRDNGNESAQSVKEGIASLQVNLSTAASPPSTPPQQVTVPPSKKRTSAPATPVRGRVERSSPVVSPVLVARRRQSVNNRVESLRAERDESTERRWEAASGVSVRVEVRTSPERAGAGATHRRFEREEWAGESIVTVNASVTPVKERSRSGED